MPRGKAKLTPAGDRAQHVASVPGQRYGEGVEQQALQQMMPAADLPTTNAAMLASAPPATATGASGQSGPAGPPQADLAALMGQMPVGLLGGTQRPDQPITAGLSSGPGPGPEGLQALRTTTPLRRMLDQLAARSGDPYFRELADRAKL